MLDRERLQLQGTVGCGLTTDMLLAGANSAYATLDVIDAQLVASESPRLAETVELANLSSMIGNILAGGIVRASAGVFDRAGPHKYQDLRAAVPKAENIEIKVALERNNPKGHLPKTGHYLTCRYVLGDKNGNYTVGERGDVIWIWEMRFGHLDAKHFNTSNTAGDSGKTAVVNKQGMAELKVVYFDPTYAPLGPRSRYELNLRQEALTTAPRRRRR